MQTYLFLLRHLRTLPPRCKISLQVGWLVCFCLFFLTGCSNDTSKNAIAPEGRLRVMATSFPLEDFTRQIGGDHIQVESLLGPGKDPHHSEPTPRERARLHESQLLVYEGIDPWIQRLSKSVQSQNKNVRLLDVAKISKETENTGHSHPSDTLTHRWLDPREAIDVVKTIGSTLIQIDPIHQPTYQKNIESLIKKLNELDHRYSTVLSKAKQKTLAVIHDGFHVLAKRYGFQYIALLDAHQEYKEPTPQRLQEIIHTLKSQGVKTLFVPPQGDSKALSENICRIIGAQPQPLHAIESITVKERQHGVNYFQLMESNLTQLATGLEVSSS